MTIDEQIAILQAYKDGTAIEYIGNNGLTDDWKEHADGNEFNFVDRTYRVKPKTQLRPYIFEEMQEAWTKHNGLVSAKNQKIHYMVTMYNESGLIINGFKLNYPSFLQYYVWADDGSVCGTSGALMNGENRHG